MHWLRQALNRYTGRDRLIYQIVYNVTGLKPRELGVYRLAFRHVSMVRDSERAFMECNERLEFLGDAILGSVIAEYLFKKYPRKDEGFLTEMRSKIVNRAQLNEISVKLQLDTVLEYDHAGNWMNKSLFGNTLEAFIGALYLDQGYRRTQRFITQKMLLYCVDVEMLADQDLNYKSRLMEYAQKHRMEAVSYELVGEENLGAVRQFTVAVKIGQTILGYGTDTKKKYAEQKASGEALIKLNVITTL
jgi:ribonuclease III